MQMVVLREFLYKSVLFLGGGFKYFILSLLFGEIIHFD